MVVTKSSVCSEISFIIIVFCVLSVYDIHIFGFLSVKKTGIFKFLLSCCLITGVGTS